MIWQLHGIVKRYRTHRLLGPSAEVVAVDGVELEVEAGERVALVGESGSGKSTLARIGLGLERPDAGTVRLLGEDTAAWSAARWRRARHDAQLLLQNPAAMLDPTLPIQLLLHESACLHTPEADPGLVVQEALRAVGLAHRAGALPHELSGGEQRRAGIARVMLTQPKLLVADEPTSGLDAVRKLALMSLLVARLDPRCALVFITHDLPLALHLCHRVVVMAGGRVVDAFAVDALDAGLEDRAPVTRDLLLGLIR